MSKKRRRKPSVSAVINASLELASESAEEFLRFLEQLEEREALKKKTSNTAPAPTTAVTK